MSEAFEEICKTLNRADEAGSQRELIAKKIIAMAQGGERSAILLCRTRPEGYPSKEASEAGRHLRVSAPNPGHFLAPAFDCRFVGDSPLVFTGSR
jgi:hypothetical protein